MFEKGICSLLGICTCHVTGTVVENGTRYEVTKGSSIETDHLDWTQLLLKSVTYEDEMLYIVEFNFSSGVSIKEYVKLDVMGKSRRRKSVRPPKFNLRYKICWSVT